MAAVASAILSPPPLTSRLSQTHLKLSKKVPEAAAFNSVVLRVRGGATSIDDDTLGNTMMEVPLQGDGEGTDKEGGGVAWTDDVGGPKTADGRASSRIAEKFIINEACFPSETSLLVFDAAHPTSGFALLYCAEGPNTLCPKVCGLRLM